MNVDLTKTALIVIDMQRDFCEKGGYAETIGLDVSYLRKPISNISKILDWAREKNLLVIHTREGHRQDLTDLLDYKRQRSEQGHAAIGSEGPLGKLMVRGEYGHDFIDELQPIAGEPIVDKPGYSAFVYTDLESILRIKKIENLIITGVTTEVCVSSTYRHATDLGFYCMTVEDACSSANVALHEAALQIIKVENGIFGAVVSTDQILRLI